MGENVLLLSAVTCEIKDVVFHDQPGIGSHYGGTVIENDIKLNKAESSNCNKGGSGGNKGEAQATYFNLLRMNRPFRLFLGSYLITHIGEWFTYVASMRAIEQFLGERSEQSRTSISVLVVIRLIPNIIWVGPGGFLADSQDRRISLITLDFVGAAVALSFLVAYKAESVVLIYFVTFAQQSIAALYEPCRSAMIPMLCPEEKFLKKATTLSGLAWSAMMAAGSSLGGLSVAAFGVPACFFLDSLTYITSAIMLLRVGGFWNAAKSETTSFASMVAGGVKYLTSSFFGPLVLLKFSAGLVCGASDVLNVSFSEQFGDKDSESSMRLGFLFACIGVGCIVGPLLAEPLTKMEEPSTFQKACVLSFALLTIGCIGIAMFSPFQSICLFTSIRAAAASINWIDSTLLLQKFSASDMLGRVSAVDYALATVSEALSALMAGLMQDNADFTAQQVALVMAGIGACNFLLWSVFHEKGHGAASEAAHSRHLCHQ